MWVKNLIFSISLSIFFIHTLYVLNRTKTTFHRHVNDREMFFLQLYLQQLMNSLIIDILFIYRNIIMANFKVENEIKEEGIDWWKLQNSRVAKKANKKEFKNPNAPYLKLWKPFEPLAL